MIRKPAMRAGLTRAQKAEIALAKRIKAERPERTHVYTLPEIRTWGIK